MKSRTLVRITAITLFAALPVPLRLGGQDRQQESSRRHTITTFEAPGAGSNAGQGTFAFALSDRGAIAGFYLDASNVYHGFLRARNGTFTTIDAPGAGTGAFQGTLAFSINPAGVITGYYLDAANVFHSYLRARDGTITEFDVPGAGAGAFQGTLAGLNINPAGAIAGNYSDASGVSHGVLRAPNGTITPFDAPGAGTGTGQGTFTGTVDCINPEGAIAGAYFDASTTFHGYVRSPDGTITEFNVPGAGTGTLQGTNVAGINGEGTIPGIYVDPSNVTHGFLRTKGGAITTFDVPGAGTGAGAAGCSLTSTCQGTYPANINREGSITGQYVDASGVNHGFLRVRREGEEGEEGKRATIITFDVPGSGTASGQGTIPISNNAADAITGYYIDASGVNHGFLRSEGDDR